MDHSTDPAASIISPPTPPRSCGTAIRASSVTSSPRKYGWDGTKEHTELMWRDHDDLAPFYKGCGGKTAR
ncbi:hypothetical protein [Bradyrhizobium sp. SZCCHNR2028]|uniref:hypothetical protein n=1 Tax=Bradyrhizobium sp. SZCCHNR2028 TaxID=3057382 RepID=UPI0028F081D9|nr:hypothetical protein [Bradyrhizobium sp. SZCCHNR2028]